MQATDDGGNREKADSDQREQCAAQRKTSNFREKHTAPKQIDNTLMFSWAVSHPTPAPLNFGGRKRSGAFDVVWPSAKPLPPVCFVAGIAFGPLCCLLSAAAHGKIVRCSPSKEMFTPLDLCVSFLRKGHANLFCIVPV